MASSTRVEELERELRKERERARNAWRMNCEQISRYDAELAEKESEIDVLKSHLEAEKLRYRDMGGRVPNPGEVPSITRRAPLSKKGRVEPEPLLDPVSSPAHGDVLPLVPISSPSRGDGPTIITRGSRRGKAPLLILSLGKTLNCV